MPSNYTEHFKLSQWERSDKVLMDDFNADNAKIDTAVASRMGPLEIIQGRTVTKTGQAASVDLSGFSWNEWSVVGAVLLNSTEKTEGHYMIAYVGGCSLDGAVTNFAYRTPGPQMVLLFPHRSIESKVCALFFPGGDIGWCNQNYSTVTGISFSSNYGGAISGNAQLVLFGIR